MSDVILFGIVAIVFGPLAIALSAIGVSIYLHYQDRDRVRHPFDGGYAHDYPRAKTRITEHVETVKPEELL